MKSQIRCIVLIGLGSIGKRHLESLMRLKHIYKIKILKYYIKSFLIKSY